MKNVQFPKFALVLPLFLCFALMQNAFAQTKPRPRTQSAKASTTIAVADDKLPEFCDKVLPKIMETMQAAAEKNCATQTSCVLCTERNTKTPVYMTVYAQPNSPRCRKVTQIATVAKPPQQTLDMPIEVMQSICTREGVSLMLSSPDVRFEVDKYTYSWEVDGKRAGNGTDLNCTCGQNVKVTVYEKGTKRSVTKSIRLNSPCKTSKN